MESDELDFEIDEMNNSMKNQKNYGGHVQMAKASSQGPNGSAIDGTHPVARVRLDFPIYPDPSEITSDEMKNLRHDLDPYLNYSAKASSTMQAGARVNLKSFGNDPAYNGRVRNLRIQSENAGSSAGMQQQGGANVPITSLNWNGPAAGPAGDGTVSSMIKKSKVNKKRKWTFGTPYRYYFPRLAEPRLKQLLVDMNAFVKARGFDVEFFNFGVIRDIEQAMNVKNIKGRSKGSNHGFGLAIDALVRGTHPTKTGSGLSPKQYTLNGKLTSDINGNYHARNKVIIKDAKLMKCLLDFSKLPKNSDIRWGGHFSRGKKIDVPGVGPLWTMELHHWEITPAKIPEYWAPYMAQLKSVGIEKAPITTKQNLAAMNALWDQYVKEQGTANPENMSEPEKKTEEENKEGGGE